MHCRVFIVLPPVGSRVGELRHVPSHSVEKSLLRRREVAPDHVSHVLSCQCLDYPAPTTELDRLNHLGPDVLNPLELVWNLGTLGPVNTTPDIRQVDYQIRP